MWTMFLATMLAAEPSGTVVAVGGGTTTRALSQKIVDLSGGANARVLIVPQASSQADAGERSASYWREFAQRVRVLSLDNADDAARAISEADLIWMPGGDQNRLMAALTKANVVEAIRKRFRSGGVVGGTSAGAAVLSAVMISGEAELDRLKRGTTKTSEGLGLWTEGIIDQHFVKRDRFNRLLSAVADRPQLIGAGIDESTGLVIRGRSLEVIGSGQVVLIDARSSKIPPGKVGEQLSAQNVRLHVLLPGTKWELSEP